MYEMLSEADHPTTRKSLWSLCNGRTTREASKRESREVMSCTPSYETGDYLLINDQGKIVAVSGNTDFWDSGVGWEKDARFDSDEQPYNIAQVISTKVHEEHDD
jgi:hypothetical protein